MEKTDEQTAILDAYHGSGDNLIVNALAGTGKTSTIEMIQAESKETRILCLAFNKAIAQEMENRFLSTTAVRTMNGLGHRIWMKTVSSINVNPRKVSEITKEHINELKGEDKKQAWEAYWTIVEGVNLAKALGYVPEGKYPAARRLIERREFHESLEERPSEFTKALIDHVLFLSIKTAYKGWIDFNDQVYLPALFGGTFPRFPVTLVDEGQDLNPVNHAMLDKLARGRIIVVGDRWQSIYGFRGAVTQGMQTLQDKFGCKPLDLSVSFRCPEKVVKHAHWRVPSLKWVKPGGVARRLDRQEARRLPDEATIICRNNAPLFRTALGLLMCGRSVSASGSELGPKIIRLLERVCDEDDNQETMLNKIEAWREEKLEKSQSPGKINDEADCLAVFAAFGKTRSEACAYVKHVFEQKGQIKLTTGHKAKGGEWPIVYHLDSWLCRDGEQDQNLRYVITTRSMDQLYEIDSKDIVW
jgi:superfamily I DNA/RNA helicase